MRTAAMIVTLMATLAACKPATEGPTRLSAPAGVTNVKEVRFLDGHAYETNFTMKVRYPANPALDHYSNVIKRPWVRCDWSPEWQRFIDGTVQPNRTVHQQMYMWINRSARRMLLLSSRYYSSASCPGNPDNDHQHIALVEYMDADIDDVIGKLKLRCPESE